MHSGVPGAQQRSAAHAAADDSSLVNDTFDDSATAVQQFFEQRGEDWPVLDETSGSIAISYGVVAVPESYLIDPMGIVRAKVVGGVTASRLDSLMQ